MNEELDNYLEWDENIVEMMFFMEMLRQFPHINLSMAQWPH